jgi:hypothetical protein
MPVPGKMVPAKAGAAVVYHNFSGERRAKSVLYSCHLTLFHLFIGGTCYGKIEE